MASSLEKPRGFGRRELIGSGHIIEVGDETFSTNSMNIKYVLSAFSGYARNHPDKRMLLLMIDGFGNSKPIAKSIDGHTSLLIMIR